MNLSTSEFFRLSTLSTSGQPMFKVLVDIKTPAKDIYLYVCQRCQLVFIRDNKYGVLGVYAIYAICLIPHIIYLYRYGGC